MYSRDLILNSHTFQVFRVANDALGYEFWRLLPGPLELDVAAAPGRLARIPVCKIWHLTPARFSTPNTRPPSSLAFTPHVTDHSEKYGSLK